EDALERLEGHALIDLAVFGRGPVLGEDLAPLRVGEGREGAEDRLPFGDRQPRVRQARHAADDDHGEHQCATNEEPRRDSARVAILRLRDDARRRGQKIRVLGDVHYADSATARRPMAAGNASSFPWTRHESAWASPALNRRRHRVMIYV